MKHVYRILLLLPLLLIVIMALPLLMWGVSSRKIDKMFIGRIAGYITGKMELDND